MDMGRGRSGKKKFSTVVFKVKFRGSLNACLSCGKKFLYIK